MKKVLITLLLFLPVFLTAQTTIPFPGFFSEITDVTNVGGSLYDITITVNDQSGEYNGNSIDTVDFVLWQNCGRYEIDSIIIQFPSQLIVRINDVDGNGSPITGFASVLEESPVLGVGFFISGILDSRNQCVLSYYAERLDLSGGVARAGVFYQFIPDEQTYSLPEDTLKKYPRIVIYASTGTLELPDLDSTEDSLYNGHKIEIRVGGDKFESPFFVTSTDTSSIISSNCFDQNPFKTGIDTLDTSIPRLYTYHLLLEDNYYRFCDDFNILYNGDVISSGDTVNANLNTILNYGNDGGGIIVNNIGNPVEPQDAVTLSYLQNFQDSIYRYTSSDGSTNAHIAANGSGITITENSGSGEVVIAIPANVEPYYINLYMPSSVTDNGAYHIVIDYEGDRNYNESKNSLNIPLVRTGLDNYSTISRANPANISENGGNSANTVTYGVSAFGGGDGSDITISLINFSLGINQMCRLDFNAIK